MTNLLLQNVLLEYGIQKNNNNPDSTITQTKDILIENGVISKIENNIPVPSNTEVYNADEQLLLPSFREMHIHIDKTYFSGPWKAPKPITNGILTRIEEEQQLLPEQLEFAPERADNFVRHLIKNGHTHIRTHCNIDPSIQLENLKVTVETLEKYKNLITYEIVAFPQHGLLRSEVTPLMREAMRNGATLVGGVDPATIDRDIDQSLSTMFDIASESDSGIDIHLHDWDTLGEFTFYKLINLTKKHQLQGRVTISHAIALGDIHGERLIAMMDALKEAGIDITTTIPINRPTIPVLTLAENGIEVSVGHDSLTDHWSPFGTGDTIEKLSTLAERFNIKHESGLAQLWKFASGGITPLNKDGEQVWPAIGDKANLLLVDASCSAETIARRKEIKQVVSRGQLVHSI
ncbi:amidohydrolase [Corticicoccus populi]|uniref:Amidohydrolase n=1 Tax=Corticicoccus populi TaxID=1812821 RepID=A0ABW5WXF0_9STAP